MSSVVIVGTQWGDEGKGKIVDALAEQAEVVARFQGGDNAGHTVYCDDKKYVFHVLPSGILREGVTNIIGAGVVLNPHRLAQELAALDLPASVWRKRLRISAEAHLILPCHPALDKVDEQRLGSQKVGTTLRGIGPAYADRASRIGVRAGDLLDEDYFRERLKVCFEPKRALLLDQPQLLDVERVAEDILTVTREWRELIADTSALLWEARAAGKHILYEGAQGAMLDVSAGSYPYVTSSHTIAGSVCVGAGVGPKAIDKVLGVTKAYVTRVGEGPFPSELTDATGEKLRALGLEYGATTRRPRRCGWLDLVLLRKATALSGLDGLILTKMDVLDDFDQIGVCVAYEVDGKVVTELPVNPTAYQNAKPVCEYWSGWRSPTSKAQSYAELPVNARRYIEEIEKRVGVPVEIVSAGPDRKQMIVRNAVF